MTASIDYARLLEFYPGHQGVLLSPEHALAVAMVVTFYGHIYGGGIKKYQVGPMVHKKYTRYKVPGIYLPIFCQQYLVIFTMVPRHSFPLKPQQG